jgi:hypothetical protein
MRNIVLTGIFSLSFLAGFSQSNVIEKIKQEEMQHSQVMDIAFHLTDVTGPRLTGSPGFTNAANWAKNTLSSWGLTNAQLEPWGGFGRSWQQDRSYVAMTKPYYVPFIAYPKAWTGSTPGNKIITRDVILIKAKDSAELMQYSGKLKDKIVMTWSNDTLRPGFKADAERYKEDALDKMAKAEPEQPRQRGQNGGNPQALQNMRTRQSFQRNLNAMLVQEKPALILSMGRGNEGTVFVQQGGQQATNAPVLPASVQLSSDDYLRLQRLVNAGIPVQLEADVKTTFFAKDTMAYNVIAEIPGTDPKLKDEIVMLGGHLDSWHAGTGATDNAAGCAVMMEAVRLLKSLNVQPKRTIRIALWSGEEQGIFGSRGYVKKHFADPADMKLLGEHEKISAYYNLDNGSGKIRGVYLQGNEQVKPIFAEWLKPFNDMGANTLTISNTGGTDHLSFDAVGIPGFQFIQDPLEYDTRTHHSNMDTYDHLVPDDLKQAAAIVAAFVYNTAQREEKLPRKPLPAARGNTQRQF